MRKQTKLVAVLSTAALLAIGASMTSFAAQGWAEEDGTWVYYDRDGNKESDEWKKSGDNWFWLDSEGDMATDMLIEDGDNYYYVDENGAMVRNQWRAIENEDSGDEDEPDYYWYYFQANGKAYRKSGSSDSAFKKAINGKTYIFDEEGKMQYGWVDESGERQVGDDAWNQAQGQDATMYYCGDENDGAMVTGWALISILDEDWDPDQYVNGDIFDEDQERWFWFKSNGKRIQDDDKTINGRKYQFDEYGRMLPEWVFGSTSTVNSSMSNTAPDDTSLSNTWNNDGDIVGTVVTDSKVDIEGYQQGQAVYSSQWKYFGDPEDGARVTKGWFQVVPSEWLSADDYDDSESNWYFSNSDGELYANEFKTIKGKKYAFDSYGAMLTGLNIIQVEPNDKNKIVEIYNTDAYDDEDKFRRMYERFATDQDTDNVYTYYFDETTGSNEGQMKTGKVTIELDGDDFTFNFEKSGSQKGRGKNGYDKDDKKVYVGGMMAKADSDEKYEFAVTYTTANGEYTRQFSLDELTAEYGESVLGTDLAGNGKSDEDYEFYYEFSNNGLANNIKTAAGSSVTKVEVKVISTSGGVQKSSKSKNGDDAYIETKNYDVVAIYEKL